MWRGWIWGLLGNDTGFLCFLWCLVLTDFCYTFQGWLLQQKPPAKGSSCSEVVSWRGAQGMLGLHPSHILFCLLLAALTGQKETSGNTEALPLPSYSCSHPSHHSKWSFNLTDRCVWGVKWCWEAHKDQTCFAGQLELGWWCQTSAVLWGPAPRTSMIQKGCGRQAWVSSRGLLHI